jgi:hypothetical protein
MENPYGAGGASMVIHDVLKNIQLNNKLIMKKFHDLPSSVEK